MSAPSSSLRVRVEEESQVGSARRAAGELARELGGDEEYAGRCSVVTSEAARNLLHHAKGGDIILRKLRPEEGTGLDLLALDRGPGIRNMAECLRDGYSTGGTAGQGLGALRRMADEFELTSQPGRGTALWCRLFLQPPAQRPSYACGAVNVALEGEAECGDHWGYAEHQGVGRLMLADGLGHGPFAAEAARQALAVLRRGSGLPLPALLQEAHQALKSTRGAAVSAVEMRPATSSLVACGVGNVNIVLVAGEAQQSFLPQRGTVGANVRQVHEVPYPWPAGSLVILHSDGIGAGWTLRDYPGLLTRHPALIAGVLFRDFRRERDDATMVVLRHLST